MSDFIPSSVHIEVESEEYSLEKEVEEILRKPLVDILVALMLINDIFLYLQEKRWIFFIGAGYIFLVPSWKPAFGIHPIPSI